MVPMITVGTTVYWKWAKPVVCGTQSGQDCNVIFLQVLSFDRYQIGFAPVPDLLKPTLGNTDYY